MSVSCLRLGLTPVNRAPVAAQKDLDLGRFGMATGLYESLGFIKAKGSVPAGVVIGSGGVTERSVRSLFLDQSIYILGLLTSYIR